MKTRTVARDKRRGIRPHAAATLRPGADTEFGRMPEGRFEGGRVRLLLLAVMILLSAAVVAALWSSSSRPRVPRLPDAEVAADPDLPETIPTLKGPVDRHLVANACEARDMWACRDLFADLYEGGRRREAMMLLRTMSAAFEAMPDKVRKYEQVERMFAAAKVMVAADGRTDQMAPGEIAILGIGTRKKEQEAADQFLKTRPMRSSSEPRRPPGALPPQLAVLRSSGSVELTNITKDHLVAIVFGDFSHADSATGRLRKFQCYWVDPATAAKVGRERVALAPGQARTLRPDCPRSMPADEGDLAFVVFDGETRQWVFLSSGY